ncbi:MAG: hypothetical protein IT478_05135 [Xanthomonadales bacterium]|nr:hypothetical protein [Xanthomonadales bacterium]
MKSVGIQQVLGLVLCAGLGSVQAETPERGLYWTPTRPHQAFYLEHQGTRSVLVVLAYDEAGHSEWFTATGALRVGTTLDIEMSDPSLYHYFTGPLERWNDGPVLGFTGDPGQYPPSPEASSIGVVTVNFSPLGEVYLDLASTLPDGPARRLSNARLSRFNFGFGGFGRNSWPSHDSCWPNLSGEWAFIDRAERTRQPWRFHFTTRSVRAWDWSRQAWLDASMMTCGFSYQPHEIVYRDDVANADLRCASTEGGPPPDFPDQAHACEVIENSTGQTLFWFFIGSSSAHPERVLARYGTPRDGVPPEEYAPIIGMRVE